MSASSTFRQLGLCLVLCGTITAVAQSTEQNHITTDFWGLSQGTVGLSMSDGTLLLYGGWSVARMGTNGTLQWARNYAYNGGPVLIQRAFEQSSGNILAAITVVEGIETSIGWMRLNAQGIPQAARLWTNAPSGSNVGSMCLHPDDGFSYFCQSQGSGELESMQFRFDATGNTLLSLGDQDAPTFTGVEGLESYGADVYMRQPFGLVRFDASGTQLWNSGSLRTLDGAFISLQGIRVHPEGVYFGFEAITESFSGVGLIDHDGEVQWMKRIVSADPVLAGNPIFSYVDVVKQDDQFAIYFDVSGQNKFFIFGMDPWGFPTFGRSAVVQFKPERLAPLQQGGLVYAYSETGLSGLNTMVASPGLDPGDCLDPVDFSLTDLSYQSVAPLTYSYAPVTSQWTPITVTQTVVNTNSSTVCTWTGVEEQEAPSFTLFPNPASDQLTIQLGDATQGAAEGWIYDLQGRMVHAARLTGTTTRWDLGHLAPGGYTMELLLGSGSDRRRAAQRLIVAP